MARVLIAYGTTEGQSARIAERLGEALRSLGHDAVVRSAREIRAADVAAHDGFIVGGSLHMGKHQREVLDFIARHEALLSARPSGFFSVSLAAASRDAGEREAAERIARTTLEHTGWAPGLVASFAGALRYSRYGWLKRMLMRRIAAKEGGDTDTSRDYEYTDWDEVTRFAEAFGGLLAAEAAGTAR